MNDGLAAAPAPPFASATADYARVYEEQQPRLVAYARSLTRNSWAAEDIVAEAHFRVWRRLAAGHEIDNVPAYLMTTVRHLASAAGTSVRETPRDPQTDKNAETDAHGDDPAEHVSSVDLLVRVLGQLPERWVKALWLAEAEGQPLAAIGPQLGTKQGATAVLLHRAREGMRQAFLREQTGAPDDPACQVHWARMPAYVRGSATARQSERLLGHVDACDDCRGRLAVLMRTNDRLPALVGPALLVFAVGGTGKFLLSFATTAATAGGHIGGLVHGVRQAVTGGSKTPKALAVGTAVAGAAALVIALGVTDSTPAPSHKAPVAQGPVAEVPAAQPPKGLVAEEPAEERDGEQGDDGEARTKQVAAPADGVAVPAVAAGVPSSSGDATGTAAGDESGGSGGTGEGKQTPAEDAPGTDTPGTDTPGSGDTGSGSSDEGTPAPEDPESPDPQTPDPESPAPQTPDPESPDPQTPDPQTPDPQTPDPQTPDPQTPDPQTPDPQTPDTDDPDSPVPSPEPHGPVDGDDGSQPGHHGHGHGHGGGCGD